MINPPLTLQEEFVWQVYERIAGHFSSTRYKQWPVVEKFLQEHVKGQDFIVDFGCGNGKNATDATGLYLGIDTCSNLLALASLSNHGKEFSLGDVSRVPLREASVDAAISIAVIHHLPTVEARLLAIREMSRTLKSGAPFLIMVWADGEHNESVQKHRDPPVRPLDPSSRVLAGDCLVPWREKGSDEEVHWRFYHLFVRGELEGLLGEFADTMQVILSGYDRDNWFVIGRRLGFNKPRM